MSVMDARGQGSLTGCKLSADSESCWLTASKAANELHKLLRAGEQDTLKTINLS